MNQHKAIRWLTQGLMLLNAIIWAGVGIASLLLTLNISGSAGWSIVYTAGFVLYGLVLVLAALALGRWPGKATWRAALGLMLLTIVLFLFDDFGLADLLAMLPALAAAAVLVFCRRQLVAANYSEEM